MNSFGLLDHSDQTKRERLEDLKEEYDAIIKDMDIIKNMQVSEEVKQPILTELQEQIDEMKEKMHAFIDRL